MKIKSITLAGFSDLLYHTTGVDKLVEILKDNKIHMASNLGTSADQRYKKEKFRPYYFSMSRVKYGGYAQTISEDWICTLVLDGTALRTKYYGQSVDYWGEDWRKTADKSAAERNEKSNRSKYDENEDRIYSDKPYIEPLNKYCTEIHINLSPECAKSALRQEMSDAEHNKAYDMNKLYKQILQTCLALKIKCYFYTDFQSFKLMNKRKASTSYAARTTHIDSLNNLFEAKTGTEDSFDRDTREDLFSVIYTGDWRDFKSSLEADLHNGRSGDRAEKAVTDTFIAHMRKNKLRDLDAVQAFLAQKFAHMK
jgi:hypothetical protein